jgi:type I restriction enzyme S subunit
MADPLVVFRYVLTQEFANRLTREQRGINYPAVTDRRVYAQPIPLPPLAEQKRIAARLEDLFSSVQEAKKSLRSVPTPQMFLQSILAKAFENCEVRRLYEIAHVFNGRAVGSGLSKTRVFKTRHVYPSGLKMDNPSYLKLEQEKYIGPDRFLRDGDVLIVNTWQNLGRVCYVDQPQSRWTVDTQISVVRPKEGSLGKFIFYFLLSKRGYDLLLSCERGALTAGRSRKLTHIYPKDIEKITIPHVSPDQQASVVKRIDLSLKYVSAMGISMQLARNHIDSLEKSILHKAFHGKLVPQDPNDEPASVLLKRIRTQRATMGKKTVHRGLEKFVSPRAIAN